MLHRLTVLAFLSVAAVLTATPAEAEDLGFTLENRSSYDVMEFYASPVDIDDYEEDILGRDVLASGESTRVTIADGSEQCEYDMLFVFADGDELRRDGVDLCETGSYTLTD